LIRGAGRTPPPGLGYFSPESSHNPPRYQERTDEQCGDDKVGLNVVSAVFVPALAFWSVNDSMNTWEELDNISIQMCVTKPIHS
jgi:hypothetical protein